MQPERGRLQEVVRGLHSGVVRKGEDALRRVVREAEDEVHDRRDRLATVRLGLIRCVGDRDAHARPCALEPPAPPHPACSWREGGHFQRTTLGEREEN